MSNHNGMRRKGEAHRKSLAIVAMFAVLVASGVPVQAATFTVNVYQGAPPPLDVGDVGDANPGDGIAEVAPSSGVTTLRAAIEEANAFPGPDIILFNVQGPVDILTPLPALDDLSGGTIIAGGLATVNGAIPDPIDPMIITITPVAFTVVSNDNVIRGLNITGFGVGVDIQGEQNTVFNSVFTACELSAIQMSGAAARNNVVQACEIGRVGAENLALGIDIAGGANNNLIGGTDPTAANIISANMLYGIRVHGVGTSGNVIQGNHIGVDLNSVPAPNGADGIVVFGGATANIVGPTDADILADLADEAANVISGNAFSGITLDNPGTSANIVRGNFIGTDVAMSMGLPNGASGVHIVGGAAQNIIGHTMAANVIAANTLYGVRISDPGTDENQVIGNRIGSTTGQGSIANLLDGVVIVTGAKFNRIGGIGVGEGNVISGNSQFGVNIEGPGTNFNSVLGNLIGTSTDGLSDVRNGAGGVRIALGAKFNQIGAEPFGSRNVISGNFFRGVEISGVGTNDNSVLGNYIGPDITGTAAIGNLGVGISVSNGAMNTVIGGVQRRERNIISGNDVSGIVILNTGTTGTLALNNYIGLDSTGQAPLPNGDSGVVIDFGASSNTIGGIAAGSRNVISANVEDGVQVSGASTIGNSIIGNYIGTNNLGEPGFGNTNNGISVVNNANATLVGGTTAGAGNLIASNLANGIEARGSGTGTARFLGNTIFGNGAKGILLSGGANQGILPPVFDTLIPIAGTTFPNAIIQVFVDSADEGELLLATITADNEGSFSTPVNLLAHLGLNMTATVTDAGTSEFSLPLLIAPPVITAEPVDTVVVVDDPAVFSVTATGAPLLSYQWQYWDGVDPLNPVFVNLVDGPNIAGAATSTLTILAASNADEGVYRCRVGNPFGQTDSQGASLTVFPNFADTAVINTLNDVLDGNTGSLARLIAVPGADARISLREAILAANNTTAPVTLSIDPALVAGGPGTAVIVLNAALPQITGSGLTLDGSDLVLEGSALGGSASGFDIRSGNNVLSGFAIVNFPGFGVQIWGTAAQNNIVRGCVIASNGGDGVRIGSGAADNVLGGTEDLQELLLIDNVGAGIRMTGVGTSGNSILGCLIGGGLVQGVLTVAGNQYGVLIDGGAGGNIVGGTDPDAGNVIVGNSSAGIRIQQTGSDGNIVQGNLIGLVPDPLGGAPAPAGNGIGVHILAGAVGNLIGGTDAGAANTIAYSIGTGVVLADTASVRNQIRRNSIFENGGDGINIRNLANNGIQPPVITGLGSVSGTAAPGATVELFTDAMDEGQNYIDTVVAAGNGSFTSAVDVSAFPNLRVTATATDANGNTSRFSEPFPIDQAPPVIQLVGPDTTTLECGSGVYQELGATASDTVDGDVTADIVTRVFLDGVEVATVDTSAAPVTYTVTYDVADSAGNNATQVTRTVNVTDTGIPLITLIGSARIVVPLGGSYTDPGATAADLCEGNLTPSIITNNPVNTNAAGDYTVTYDVADSAGNAAVQKQRTVSVLASIGVTLTLNGPASLATECGMPFVDPGATAVDQQGNDISDRVEVTGTVDTSAVGATFALFYNATDAQGNPAATISRNVEVVDTAPPTITLVGAAAVELTCFSFYEDAGAVATDACEGDVSHLLTVTSNVDTATPGQYEVRYRASDGRGNQAASVARMVVVLACNSECALQCQNEENPVDGDGDGLTACVENCLGTSDQNPDSDGDGMPDEFEINNGLDPRTPDADGDLDQDASTNLDEFLDGSHPGDPNSPHRTVYVGPNGTDTLTSGTFSQPYRTIGFALQNIFNPDLNPTRVVAFAGSYAEHLTLVPNVTLTGALGQEVVVGGTMLGSANAQVVNLTLFADTGDDVLLDMNDVAMNVRGVLFEGTSARPGVGILASGASPASSVIEGCAFFSLNAGIEVSGATPLVRDCSFAEMSVAGVLFNAGADVASNANGRFGDTGTGWNQFDIESIDGAAVINMNATTAVMEINSWNTDIADRIELDLDGPVDFVPFLGAGTAGLAATVYVTAWDATTQERIENASVTLLGEEFDPVTVNRNGVYTFALVPGQEYLVEVRARRYETKTLRFEVDPGQRRSLIVPLLPRKGGVIGCHAGTTDAQGTLGYLLPALAATALLLYRTRTMRRRAVR